MSKKWCENGSKGGMPLYVCNENIRPNMSQWSQMASTRANCGPNAGHNCVPVMPSIVSPHVWSHSTHPITHPMSNNYGMFANNGHTCYASNCRQYENNWTNVSHNTYDSKHANIAQMAETGDNGVNSDESQNTTHNEFESQKMANHSKDEQNLEIKQLKGINEMLKSSLEQTNGKLKETQNILLKMNEKFAMDYIDKYRLNLKKYGDYIREECNRFYQNETIAKKLEPIVEQITQASFKAKEEKERIRDTITSTQMILNEEINANLDVLPFDYNCLPQFPDLLSFYKSILDEIPLIFLADLTQLKMFANKYIQTKKQSNVEQSLTNGSAYEELNTFQTLSNPLFRSPNIEDLPHNVFGIDDKFNNNFLSEDKTSQSVNELPFPKNVNTLPNNPFNHLSNGITSNVEPKSSTPKPNEKAIPPIGQPLQTQVIECAENNGVSNESTIEAKAETIDPIVSKCETKNTAFSQNSLVNSSSNALKPNLSQAQSKLLVKLREKYNHLSEDLLINSITQTKSSLVNSGHSKGFSGMRVSDIINKISEYIDKNIISVNNPKNRVAKPMPSLKLISSTNQNISQPIVAKVWANQLGTTRDTNDDNFCSICFESISLIAKHETECHHFFHIACISNWIKTDASCPICRCLVLPIGEYPQL